MYILQSPTNYHERESELPYCYIHYHEETLSDKIKKNSQKVMTLAGLVDIICLKSCTTENNNIKVLSLNIIC